MFTRTLPVLLILFSAFPVLLPQQIFENDRATCEYINYNVTEKEDRKVQIQNELWNITGTGRNSAIRVLLSPCGDTIPPTMGCGSGAVVCIINARYRRKSILNAGKHFNYTVDEEKGKTILRSIDGQACSPDENYTVIVEFDCSPTMKTAPTFLYKDDCELRIGMMKPTCTPTCTTKIDGNLIDLRPLQLESVIVQEPSKKRTFALSFCNAARQCGTGDSTACETTGGSIVPIANLHWQRITYDPFKNNLIVKSHVGTNKRIRIDTEIYIKCNWNVQGIRNLEYIVPTTQGKRYQFKGESSLACIKLPMDCVIKHSFENYWAYNLTSLNKQNGNWKVENVNFGNIYINICGPLRMSQPNRDCSDQYSQVCYVNGTRHINLGSVPIEFHVTPEDTVTGKFVDGGICAVNQNLTYSTEIEFSCSRTEKGPILNVINNCTYKIRWETPAACSKQYVTSEDCLLSDVTGNINLNGFHRTSDRIYNFTQTSYLRYNLCGPLNKPCNRNEDVSVCYVDNGQEYVAGFSNKVLIRDDALLSLNLRGDKCNSRTTRMTTIYFSCNYSAPSDGNVKINMVKDNCLFEINIDTPLACVLPLFAECKVYHDNLLFDLTPLSLNSSNYLVRDRNVDYIINVCHSVINSGGSLCPPGTGACMNNLTQPHMRHKYLSLGNVNSKSVPTIENGNLVIRYTAGSYCAEADTFKRSTVIRFQCLNREEGPRLLTKNSCSHEFVWQTRKACGKRVLSVKTRATNSVCKYRHPHTGKLIDFSNIQKILHIETETGELYKFSLCESNYTHCTSNGTACKTIESPVQLLGNKTDVYLEYPLQNQCTDSNTQANILRLYLKCNPTQGNEHFNVTGISNCVFHINLLTNLACTSKESALLLPIPTNPEAMVGTKEHDFQNDRVTDHAANISVIHPNAAPSNITKSIGNSTSSEINKPLLRYPSITSNAVPSNITKSTSNRTYNEINKPLLHYPSKTSKRNDCVVKSSETSSELALNHIKPIYVKSSTGFNYTVTIKEPLAACGGYICKNNLQIVSETDECPSIQFNITYSVIKLLYNSNQVCDSGSLYHSEIWLKCNSTVEQPSILQEDKCNVVITYPLQDACSLLRTAEPYASSAEISIYSSVGLLIVAILAILGVILIKKHPPKICSRSCYQQIPEGTENMVVHFKMKEM